MRVDIPPCSILSKDDSALEINNFCTSNPEKTIVLYKI